MSRSSRDYVLDPEQRELRELRRSRGRSWSANLVCVGLALLVLGVFVAPRLLGYESFALAGNSMAPSMPRGTLVYSKPTAISALRVGDVVTYVPPQQSLPVTHRIARIETNKAGELTFRTKGDNNEVEDPWAAVLHGEPAVRQQSIEHVGWLMLWFGIKWVRLLIIAIPAVLIAWFCVRDLMREAAASKAPTAVTA